MHSPLPRAPGRTVRLLVTASLILATAAAVAMVAFAVYRNRQYTNGADAIQESNTVILSSEQVVKLLLDAETAERGYLLTGDPGYLNPYLAASPLILSRIDALRSLRPGDPQIDTMRELAAQKLGELHSAIETYQTQGSTAALAIVETNKGSVLMGQLREIAASLQSTESQTLTARSADASSKARYARLIVGGLAALVLLSTVCILVVLLRAFRASALDAKAVLDDSDARYHTLSEALPQIIWTATADGALDYFNERWFEYSGMDYAASVGWGWGSSVHTDDLALCLERWNRALSTGVIYETEFRLRRADGEYLWHLARALPLLTARGQRSWFGTCTDIDQQKRTEAQLIAANRVKDDFLGMVSHELRTPLVVIAGNANLLREREQELTREDRRAAYDDVTRAARRLQERVENMLVVSRHESEGSEEPEPVLVQHVLNAVVAECRASYPGRAFNVVVDRGLPAAAANAGHVEQVLQNLLGNAEKYGGSGPVDVTAVAEGAELLIRVSDRGPGIQDEDLERLFEPFFRATATAKSASGIGLGLAVCQRLVEFHGGRIWAQRRPGGGTEFGFTLPIYEAEPPGES